MSAFRQLRLTGARKRGLLPRFAAAAALVAGSALVLTTGQTATAAIVPTVPMGTAANYSVLAYSTVTNTGPSVIGQSVGLSPGTSITGFPPGIVLPPATSETESGVTSLAQNDLTTAYTDAAGRPGATQTPADLVGQTLLPGVYAASSKGPLGLSGQLVLDGGGDPAAVFIFQTDSTLVTSSGSTIALINGASECNVFWQVGSSATLGTGSFFVGTILAQASVTVTTSTVVHGRALARTAAVTLDTNVFTQPSCTPSTELTPNATAPATTAPAATIPGDTIPATTTPAPVTSFPPTDITLPATGTGSLVTQSGVGFGVLLIGLAALLVARRRQPA